MQFLVGDWGCEDRYQTRHGQISVPLITKITRGLNGQWLVIHREEPAWSDEPTNYIEEEYTGFDASRGKWVTISASTEGVQGYLTGTGWVNGRFDWSAHTYGGLDLPSQRKVIWRKLNDGEMIVEFHYPPTGDGVQLLSQHCLKRENWSL